MNKIIYGMKDFGEITFFKLYFSTLKQQEMFDPKNQDDDR